MREMKMNCERARVIIDSWHNDEAIAADDFAALLDHIGECNTCRVRYRMILPLIERDLRGEAVDALNAEPTDPIFTQRVMEGIGGSIRPFPGRFGSSPLRKAIPAAAAAAVLLLAVGLLVRGISPGGEVGEVTVHFVLDAPGAQQVSLVGSFNSWNPDTLPLTRTPGSQHWELSLKLKPGETYLYNFVVNGKTWIPDPMSDIQVEDGFGGESSLMQL